MTDGPANEGGFARQLLARAEGRVQGAQPKIPSYTAGEGGDNAPPIVEWTEEVTISSRPDRDQTSAPAEFERRAGEPQLPASESAASESSFRLFPRERPARQDSREPDRHSIPVEYGDAALDAATERRAETVVQPDRITPGQRQVATQPVTDPGHEIDDVRLIPPRGAQFPRAFDHGAELQAAIAQLLGDRPGESASRSEQCDAPSRADREPSGGRPNPRIPDDGARTERAEKQQQAPLNIHIGEIVIAPDPARPRAETPARDQWQPPLSLDEYRAQRTREWK